MTSASTMSCCSCYAKLLRSKISFFQYHQFQRSKSFVSKQCFSFFFFIGYICHQNWFKILKTSKGKKTFLLAAPSDAAYLAMSII